MLRASGLFSLVLFGASLFTSCDCAADLGSPNACSPVAESVAASKPLDVFEAVNSYVEVRVSGKDGNPLGCGSGVVLFERGEVVVMTADHVVDGVDNGDTYDLIKRSESGGGMIVWTAKVAYRAAGIDLALLRPDNPSGLIPAVVADGAKPAMRGEPVWYVGTPMGMHGSLERSIVNHPTYRHEDDHVYLAVNGNGWFGNSGCGVYVERAGRLCLVGIVSRGVWGDERTPILCEPLDSITAVLAAYRK